MPSPVTRPSPPTEPPAHFRVEQHGRWLAPMSAEDIVQALEAGELSLDARLCPQGSTQVRPLRNSLRDLVWQAWRNQQPASRPGPRETPYQAAFHGAHAGLVISDLSGRMQVVNRAFAELLGRGPTELEGELIGNISVAEDRPRELKLGNEMMRGERTGFQVAKRFIHADGSEVPALVAISLVRDAEGLPQVVVASVVDARERLTEEARQRSVVAVDAMQLVARGVVHDQNNLLQVISFAADELEHEHGMRDHLTVQAIRQALAVTARLQERLRTLSAMGQGGLEELDLAAELRSREVLLRRLVGEDHVLCLDVPRAPVWKEGSRQALDEVVLNLVLNARQASYPGGRVHIRLTDSPEEVVLSVEDEGKGMSEEVRRRALEPFYSQRTGGSGLGLAVVSAAVTRCKGTLDIESERGKGTCVRVRLRR